MSDEVTSALRRAQGFIDLDRREDARETLQAAIARHGDTADLWAALSRVEAMGADYERARGAAQRALGIDPTSLMALHALAAAQFHLGLRDDARATADRLVALHPDSTAALLQRAFVRSWTLTGGYGPRVPRSLGDADRQVVRDDAMKAVMLDPQNPATLGEAAEVHLTIGDAQQGIDLLDSALRISPDNERLLLVRARLGAGEPEQLAIVERVLAVNPRQPDALRMLQIALWRRLIRTAAVPMVPTAIAVFIAAASLLYGAADAGRGFALVFFGIGGIAVAFSWWRLGAIAKPERLTTFFRSAPLGLIGFLLVAPTTVLLLATIVMLVVMPLEDEPALRGLASGLALSVVGYATTDMLMRVASARLALRTGAFPDTPAGRLAARYLAKGQRDGTVGRVLLALIVPWSIVFGGWEGGVGAVLATTLAVLSTVFVKSATFARLRRSRSLAVWVALAIGSYGLTCYWLVFHLLDGRIGR